MTKYLKFFTSDNDRTFYESSNEYLEPYVSVTKKKWWGSVKDFLQFSSKHNINYE